jgi:hypothetical protein
MTEDEPSAMPYAMQFASRSHELNACTVRTVEFRRLPVCGFARDMRWTEGGQTRTTMQESDKGKELKMVLRYPTNKLYNLLFLTKRKDPTGTWYSTRSLLHSLKQPLGDD